MQNIGSGYHFRWSEPGNFEILYEVPKIHRVLVRNNLLYKYELRMWQHFYTNTSTITFHMNEKLFRCVSNP